MEIKQPATRRTILSDDWWISEAIVGILLLQMTHMVSSLSSSFMNAWCYHIVIFSSYLMCEIHWEFRNFLFHSIHLHEIIYAYLETLTLNFYIFARRYRELWYSFIFESQFDHLVIFQTLFYSGRATYTVHQTSFSKQTKFQNCDSFNNFSLMN